MTRWSRDGVCRFEACGRRRHARGYCGPHYEQDRKGVLGQVRHKRSHGATRERDEDGRKFCPPCGRWLSEADFNDKGQNTADGLSTQCRECLRDYKRLRAYGLTPEQFHAMRESQGDRCAICNTSDPGGRKSGRYLHIDHCHRTGRIRGLLCANCNTAIGKLQDSPSLLRRAADYIEDDCN